MLLFSLMVCGVPSLARYPATSGLICHVVHMFMCSQHSPANIFCAVSADGANVAVTISLVSFEF